MKLKLSHFFLDSENSTYTKDNNNTKNVSQAYFRVITFAF